MRSVRLNVFETNSSATHAFTIAGQYMKEEDLPNRKPESLPALDAKGILHIELKTYWDSGSSVADLDLHDPASIIEYLAAQVVFSDVKTIWSRRNREYRDTYSENVKDLLEVLQIAYGMLGREKPKGFKIFFYTINDEKHYLTKTNHNDFFTGYSEEYYYDTSYKEFLDDIEERRKEHPKTKNWPIAKYRIGVASNDLTSGSFIDACDHFRSDGYFGSPNSLTLSAIGMLVKDVSLYFYHT